MTAEDDAASELVLRGGRWVDVVGKRVVEGDIVVRGDRIHAVEPPGGSYRDATTIDVTGRVVAPGLIDSHMHIESSLLVPLEFAAAAAPRGTTHVFVDPHEIANVCGRRGVDLFLEQAAVAPIGISVGIPSCVPATDLEDAGAAIDAEDVRALLPDPRIFGLAEMMNFPGILEGLGSARTLVDLAHDFGKVVDGHAPGVRGDALRRYASNGRDDGVVRIRSDHECTTAEEAIERREAGVSVLLRDGSAARDVGRILPGVLERYGTDLAGFSLCSDDVDPAEVESDGHVDRLVRLARDVLVEHAGLDEQAAAVLALSLATIEPARHFAPFFDYHDLPPIGSIAVGHRADLVVFGSLEELDVQEVVCRGRRVASEGRFTGELPSYDYTPFMDSVRVGAAIEAADFRVAAEGTTDRVDVRAIGARGDSLVTTTEIVSLEAANGSIATDPTRDVAKIAVFERHRATGSRAIGFVRGLGLRRGAIASTVAHDSHNLVVAGADDESMAAAARRLVEEGGGLAVSLGGETTSLALPVSGLMSTEPVGRVAADLRALLDASRKTGTSLPNPFMTLSFLSLPVIPELKITNRGLVDVDRFEMVPLVAS